MLFLKKSALFFCFSFNMIIFSIYFLDFISFSVRKYEKELNYMQKIKAFLLGTAAGILNSLFGAGGGIIVIPYLKNKGLDQKSAQASALPALAVMSTISAITYLNNNYFSLKDALLFIPFGLIGALSGNMLFGKIPERLLSIAFALFLCYSGIRMLMR